MQGHCHVLNGLSHLGLTVLTGAVGGGLWLGCHGNLLAAEESVPPFLLVLQHLPCSKLA